MTEERGASWEEQGGGEGNEEREAGSKKQGAKCIGNSDRGVVTEQRAARSEERVGKSKGEERGEEKWGEGGEVRRQERRARSGERGVGSEK